MAHIDLMNDLPGIRGLMAFDPQAADALNGLANVLLCRESTLTKGERELIATYVSSLNDCLFCQSVHGAVASFHFGDTNGDLIKQVKSNFAEAPISSKMKALLGIASSVQRGGKMVEHRQILDAIAKGATDQEIHDTVLIAAAFCMFNRYVDGLGTWAPEDQQMYKDRAPGIAETGYTRPGQNTKQG